MSCPDRPLDGGLETIHLGDGAYAQRRGDDVVLFLSDGITDHSRIVLGPRELAVLARFVAGEARGDPYPYREA